MDWIHTIGERITKLMGVDLETDEGVAKNSTRIKLFNQ